MPNISVRTKKYRAMAKMIYLVVGSIIIRLHGHKGARVSSHRGIISSSVLLIIVTGTNAGEKSISYLRIFY